MGLAGCTEAPSANERERFAFLAPDNQTGDASFDWAAAVIHRGIAAEVGIGVAFDSIADARIAGFANRIVYSTLTRADGDGELRLHSALFDPDGHKLVREFTVTGKAFEVINRMSRNLVPEPYALGVKSDEALRKWPIPTGTVADFETKCVEVATAEPLFGPAIGGCLEQLRNMSLANPERLEPMRNVLSQVPAANYEGFSPEVQYDFAQAYMALKEYPKAETLYKMASSTLPVVKNMLGYTQAMTGDCAGARKSIEEYGQIPGEEPNALDSLGEVAYFCGQFKDAEQYFTQSAASKWRTEQGQIEPVKAAAARLMSGDARGAQQMAEAHFQKIGKSDPRAVAALEPAWKSITGASTPDERRARIEATLIHRP